MPGSSGATVTVIFADVEGSTALLERLGQARWLTWLAEYEEMLAQSIARHGGTLVKALGDGHLLAFPSANAALRCAVEVQRALPLAGAPDLRVRMGLHTGEPVALEDDLHGRTVVKAARIADLAHGGEVLVSGIVRELAETDADLEEEIWFEESREVELRGLRGRHLVLAAQWQREDRGPIRVVIADDSAIVRDGVAALLRECGVHVAGLATDPESLYREIERHRPDVALVDIRMPPTGTNEGLVAAEHIGREYPEVGVLVLSQYLELAYALRLVEGQEARRGYLIKDRVGEIETLLDAVRRVANGGCVVDPGDRRAPGDPGRGRRPARRALRARARGPGPHRRGALRRGDRRAPGRRARGGGDGGRADLRQARSARRARRRSAGGRGPHLPARDGARKGPAGKPARQDAPFCPMWRIGRLSGTIEACLHKHGGGSSRGRRRTRRPAPSARRTAADAA